MPNYSEYQNATIAAIASPPGSGGIGIIRLSGSDSLGVLERIFRPGKRNIFTDSQSESAVTKTSPLPQASSSSFPSHRLRYGWIINPSDGSAIDEVMAVYMAAPSSYTREDSAEIYCHGGYIVLKEILALVLAEEGVREAEPGEFSKRAFLNGRIDLSQAEAVLDIMNARTRTGLKIALSQLEGGLRQRVAKLSQVALRLLAMVEVAIDFPEDEAEILSAQEMAISLENELLNPIKSLISSGADARIFREGGAVVILGRPNVGKSSLLNALLGEERAIVSKLAGTTRDTIEEYLDIKGIPLRIIDTAGIRKTREEVEDMGIERAKTRARSAELVLLLLDAENGYCQEDLSIFESVRDQKLLILVNKLDLENLSAPLSFDNLSAWSPPFPLALMHGISARSGAGLDELKERIFELLTQGQKQDPDFNCAPNARHQAALKKALKAGELLLAGLKENRAPELIAVELQSLLGYLGEISGESSHDDMLDAVFSNFCIGK